MKRRTDEGGVAARRAVVRWAWRLFRREWRQQTLVLALLGVAVAATVGIASAVYNLTPARGDADFGSAIGLLEADEVDADQVDAIAASAEDWFGRVDVIRYQEVAVRGLINPLQLRAQDPAGPYSEPMLSLSQGRYPNDSDEIAVTDGVANDLEIGIGGRFDAEGATKRVVGLVENPNDLDDEFILVAPRTDGSFETDSVAILVGGSRERLESFRPPGEALLDVRVRASNEGGFAAAGVVGVAAVVLLLVSLIAAAGFVVVAERRLRQMGMLAAIGATERHLRMVVVANGAVVGTVAASIGGSVGLLGWWLAAPGLETAAQQRIDRLNLPWSLIGFSMVLTIITATAAAWWPARVVARVPVMMALSGRPPRPKGTNASVATAAGFVAGGLGALAVAGDVSDNVGMNWANVLLVVVGTIATIIGVLLLCPFAVRLLAEAARWAPIAVRLALRDLARYSARSSVALAAISLALGIPVAIVVSATAAEQGPAEGNLSERQLLVRGDQADDSGVAFLAERTPAELKELEASVAELASRLDRDASVTEFEVAFDPSAEPYPDGSREVIAIGRRAGDGWQGVAPVYVATPELLERLDIDPSEFDPGSELITSEKGDIKYVGADSDSLITDVATIESDYTSLPRAILTTDGLSSHGWEAAPSAWLVEASQPITDDQFTTARNQAIAAGLNVEARRGQGGLAQLRSGATAAGMLLALGVLAMTVGLMRTEAARDLRTLTATGATSTVRRGLTAATAGGLALGGVVMGTAGAYLALAAGYLDDVGYLTPVPVLHLAAMVVGVPVVAAAAGWLLAGREPPALARQAIE